MEVRKSSKKTRSYGGSPRSSRTSQNPPPNPSSAARPQYKERVRSAPLEVPQIDEQRQQRTAQQMFAGKVRRESQESRTSEPVSRPLGRLFAPVSNESAVHAQPCGNNGRVKMSSTCYKRDEFANLGAKTADVHEVILAVVGAPAVGKSTFVRCALDLKNAPTSPISSKKVCLEGKISVVKLLELGFEDLGIAADQSVRWPTKVGDYNTPIIDGVLALYDVKDQGSIACIPALLSESFGCQQFFLPSETMKRLEFSGVIQRQGVKDKQ